MNSVGGHRAELAFRYPVGTHTRKHGPGGYASYEQYRDWLRDEFAFRCLLCLRREQWLGRTAQFHIDHVKPQIAAPKGVRDYDNLVYLCARCNEVKSDWCVPDPCTLALHECLEVQGDGTIEALSREGELLVAVYRLDSKELVEYRAKMIRTFRALEKTAPEVLRQWLRYPDDLPDLARKRPPWNVRPNGVHSCCFALRERGELPEVY